MQVEIGNDHAIEGYYDLDGTLQHRAVPGQRTTTIVLPDGMGLQEALTTVIGALQSHMDVLDEDDKPVKPAWIKTDSEGLKALLVEHYGMTRNVRPRTWGNDIEEH